MRLGAMISAVLFALVACSPGGLSEATLLVSPLQPPDIDPRDGFGGAVKLEARTERTTAVFHLEVLHGEKSVLSGEVGSLPLGDLPARVTMATETTEGAGSMRFEMSPLSEGAAAAEPMRSFACLLPEEFPATGGGMTSPVLLLDPAEHPDDARVPVFGIRRGGTISFTGPDGPFSSSEAVLRVVLELR